MKPFSEARLAEVQEEAWALPFSVPLRKLETYRSYYARLTRANYCEYIGLDHRARLAAAAYPDQANRKLGLAVELMGGLPVGTFSSQEHCRPRLCADPDCRCAEVVAGARHLCLECAKGESVGLVDNLEPYVCVHHQRWVGPGAGAEGQLSVRGIRDYTSAGIKHRRLLKAGKLDPLRFQAIWELFTKAYLDGRFMPQTVGIAFDWRFEKEKHSPAVTYPAALEMYASLEEPGILERILRPGNTLQQVEAILIEIVERVTDVTCDPELARDLRYHLRADFYRVALASTPGWHDGRCTVYPPPKVAPHDRDLSGIDYSRWPTRRVGIAPGFPGFDSPESPMFIGPHQKDEFRHEFWYDVRGDLFDDIRRSPRMKSVWICGAGHTFESSVVSRERTPRTGCQACVKKSRFQESLTSQLVGQMCSSTGTT